MCYDELMNDLEDFDEYMKNEETKKKTIHDMPMPKVAEYVNRYHAQKKIYIFIVQNTKRNAEIIRKTYKLTNEDDYNVADFIAVDVKEKRVFPVWFSDIDEAMYDNDELNDFLNDCIARNL